MNYGLIGKSLTHSYSKLIHEHILENYTYELHPVKDIHTFMQEKDFKAINVTIPYKQAVLPYLDNIDSHARKIQAVNTIVNKEGKLYGYNTDYYGFLYTLKKNNIDVYEKKVLILGDGGASKAIQALIQDLQAKTILIANRSQKTHTISFQEAIQKHTDAQIIINTTPCGMYPNVDQACIDLTPFQQAQAFIDCIYNPLETKMSMQAKQLKIPTVVTGLEMLVAQAVKALEYFKDIQLDEEVIETTYQWLLNTISKV